MAKDQPIHHIEPAHGFNGDALDCTVCHTDSHLILESIQPSHSRTSGKVSVEYSCGKCKAFFAHETHVQSVARILAKNHGSGGILKFGRYYIHCGEPMGRGSLKLTTLKMAGGDLLDATELELPTTVLRCHCGFQMTIPRS